MAANTHAVTLRGTMDVNDCCDIFSGSNKVELNFNRRVNLTHDQPRHLFEVTACAGGETRGHLRVSVQLRGTEVLIARPVLRLFEESSCNNWDLDGQASRAAKNISVGNSDGWSMAAVSNEFNKVDSALAWFTVSHGIGADIGRPREPSNVIASRVPEDSHRIALQWDDNATNETGYEIRNTTINQTARLAPNTTKTTWYQPIVFKACFQVRAVGDRGPSDWTPVGTAVECV